MNCLPGRALTVVMLLVMMAVIGGPASVLGQDASAPPALPAPPGSPSFPGPTSPAPTTVVTESVAPSAASDDPCAILSLDGLNAATGLAFTTAIATGMSDCVYSGDSRTNPTVVDVATGGGETFASFKQLFPDGQDVTGVGQDAWWEDAIGVLAVDLGNDELLQVMLIDLQSATGQQSVDVASAIAKAALAGS